LITVPKDEELTDHQRAAFGLHDLGAALGAILDSRGWTLESKLGEEWEFRRGTQRIAPAKLAAPPRMTTEPEGEYLGPLRA
jgi:hypothetical protein